MGAVASFAATKRCSISSIDMDGNVKLGPRATPDEAAKLFWKAISMNAPPTCPPPPPVQLCQAVPCSMVVGERSVTLSADDLTVVIDKMRRLEAENAHLHALLGATRP